MNKFKNRYSDRQRHAIIFNVNSRLKLVRYSFSSNVSAGFLVCEVLSKCKYNSLFNNINMLTLEQCKYFWNDLKIEFDKLGIYSFEQLIEYEFTCDDFVALLLQIINKLDPNVVINATSSVHQLNFNVEGLD